MNRVFALCFCIGFVAHAHGNLINNGSFEQGVFVPGGDNGMQLDPGSTDLVGWSVLGNEIAWLGTPNSYSVAANDGDRFIDLSGYGDNLSEGRIEQSFTTSVGQQYTVRFDQGASSLYGESRVKVAAGASIQTFSLNPSEVNMWVSRSFSFTATSASTTLSFAEETTAGSNIYHGLDNVVVEAVPEPTSLVTLCSGALAWMRFRNVRRRKPTSVE